MSRSKLQRTVCVLVATFTLALPLAAQPRDAGTATTLLDRLIFVLWEHLAPFAVPSKDSTSSAPADSTDSTTADDGEDDTDGRAHIDPNG